MRIQSGDGNTGSGALGDCMKNLFFGQEVYIHGQVRIGDDFIYVNSRGAVIEPRPGDRRALCHVLDICGREEIVEVNKRFIKDATPKRRKEKPTKACLLQKELKEEVTEREAT